MLDSYSFITHVWIFSFVPLICFCANPILYLLLCICTISKAQMLILPTLFFLLRTVLAIQGLLWFHVYFRITFFYFCEENDSNYDWDCIEFVNGFCRMYIFTVFIVSLHEQWVSFHFLVSLSFPSEVYSFLPKGPSLPWLGLILEIYFLWGYCEWECVHDLLLCTFVDGV